jgi:hypothetical protein
MADPIDLRFQSNAPMAAIIQAYQNKAEMQEKMKMDQNAIENQNINRIAGVFQGAASLTSGLVQQAEQRQRMAALMTQVDKGGISVPVAQPTGPNASVEPSAPFADTEGQAPQQPPQMQLLKDTPEWQSRTRELALSAFPKQAGEALSKSLFEDPNGARNGAGRQQIIRYATMNGPMKGIGQLGFGDPNGKKFYDQHGQDITEPISVSFAYGIGQDPVTGEQTLENRGTGEVTPNPTKGTDGSPRKLHDLPLPIQAKVDEEVARYTGDPIQTAARSSLSQVANMRNILDTDVGAASEPLRSLAARVIAGEKGVLTDMDVARQAGNQALIPRVKRLVKRWADGKLTDQDKSELGQVLDAVETNSQQRFDRTTEVYARRISNRYRVDPEDVRDYLTLNTDFNTDPSAKGKNTGVGSNDSDIDARIAAGLKKVEDLEKRVGKKP